MKIDSIVSQFPLQKCRRNRESEVRRLRPKLCKFISIVGAQKRISWSQKVSKKLKLYCIILKFQQFRTGTVAPGPSTCDICGLQKPTRRQISDHIRKTHLILPTTCNFCGKLFRIPSLMKYHMKYHLPKQHRCTFCDKKYVVSFLVSTLTFSMFFDFFYQTAKDLQRHKQSAHNMGPGYKCEYCQATFRSLPSVSNHRIKVHGIRRKEFKSWYHTGEDSQNQNRV